MSIFYLFLALYVIVGAITMHTFRQKKMYLALSAYIVAFLFFLALFPFAGLFAPLSLRLMWVDVCGSVDAASRLTLLFALTIVLFIAVSAVSVVKFSIAVVRSLMKSEETRTYPKHSRPKIGFEYIAPKVVYNFCHKFCRYRC